MGQRTIYVREEHEALWDQAKKLGTEESLSVIIAEGLRRFIVEREARNERQERGTDLTPTQRSKKGESTLIGNAGEYATMAEILKRSIIAGLTPRNTPAFDIIATHQNHTVSIRVKTKTTGTPSWQWNAKPETKIIFARLQRFDDFVVLVDLGHEEIPTRFFVIPTTQIDRWLTSDYEQWVRTPGKKGQAHNLENSRRMLRYSDYADRLSPYKDAWNTLFEKSLAKKEEANEV